MRKGLGKKAVVLLSGAALGVMITSAAAAQTAPAPAAEQSQGGIQDIVVTAQKRTENVQNVPIAITAFTAGALRERAVGDISALTSVVPNVTFDASTPFSGSTAVLGASIRGIGSDDFAFNIDQAVGVYLDGVYLGRSVGANQDLLDVERIEILKGPQGTLFGRNTIGGAVSIVTHDPGDKFRFNGDVTTGSYRRFQVRGTADIPLATGLSASVSFNMLKRDGYQHRIPYPGTAIDDSFTNFAAAGYNTNGNAQGGDDTWSVRTKLKYTSGNFKALLSFDYTDVDQESTPNTLLATTVAQADGSLAGIYNACVTAPAAVTTALFNYACGPRTYTTGYNSGPALSGSGYTPYGNQFITNNIDTTYANGNNYSIVRQYGVGLTMEDQLTPNLQLRSISAYRNVYLNAGLDLDGSPLNILDTSFTVAQHQWSQEFQLNGTSSDKKLKYTAGVYAFSEAGELHDYVTFADGLLQVDGPGRINTEALAAFGQIDYRFNELIGITLGGRYTHEHKNYYGGQADDNAFAYKISGCYPVLACVAGTVFGPGGIGFPVNNNYSATMSYYSNLSPALASAVDYYPASPNSQNFNNFSPKVGIQLHPSDRVMVYGSWTRGYRSGGWTTRLSSPDSAAPEFGPEKAQTFEIGVKSQLLDKKLQLNLAAFDTDYNGIQLNQQVGVSPVVANLGNAVVRGFEAEFVAAPSKEFTLSGSLGYLDAHYTYVCNGAANEQAFCFGSSAVVGTLDGANTQQLGLNVGSTLPKAPHWKMNISPRYELDTGHGKVVLLADYTHTTSQRNDSQGTVLLIRQATDIVNASISYKPDGANWTLTGGGTNLTNDRYLVTGQSQVSGGEIYGTYNRPAEWYVKLGIKF